MEPAFGTVSLRPVLTVIVWLVCALFASGCVSTSRTLTGANLVVKTPMVSWAEEQILKTRGVFLYRLIPSNEVNPRIHRAAFLQQRSRLIAVAVESAPVAWGKYDSGKVHFALSSEFEPSTHCFAVVSASGYLVATAAFGSDDKRYFIGLYPYSKMLASRNSEYAKIRNLECAGTFEDFESKHTQLYAIGTP
ncbi:MAG: hypothetical protein KIT40_09445 [Nitrospira sp.]|nr:hypothetical protein [Nitrospira sp.]